MVCYILLNCSIPFMGNYYIKVIMKLCTISDIALSEQSPFYFLVYYIFYLRNCTGAPITSSLVGIRLQCTLDHAQCTMHPSSSLLSYNTSGNQLSLHLHKLLHQLKKFSSFLKIRN
jgi:hypothetical protein